jgi:gliding motility-associated-like protein
MYFNIPIPDYSMKAIQPLFKKNIFLFIVILVAMKVQAQEPTSSLGKDFWLGFMNNNDSMWTDDRQLKLFISSENATTGTVSIPLQGWSTTFSIVPNTTTTVNIPNNIAEHFSNDVVDTRSVHIETLDTVSVVALNFIDNSVATTTVFPVQSLGTDYIVVSYKGLNASGGFFESEFLIVATAAATQIEIVPSVNTFGGHAAGVPYTINLNKGESYQVYAASFEDDLTGSRVKALNQSGGCKPFAVFSGTQCTKVPDCIACDHLWQQLQPIDSWGLEYYLVHFAGIVHPTYTYRIIARDNGTVVTVDNGAPIALNSLEFVEFNYVATDSKVSANKPISVIQFMEGAACAYSGGEPSMLILNAANQNIKSATFTTVDLIGQRILNFISLIVETADVGTVLLDNVLIPAGDYAPFPAAPSKSFANIEITTGSHTLSAPNGFTAYAYGHAVSESYAFSLGFFEPEPELGLDTVVCRNDTLVLVPEEVLSSPVWTTLADPSTVIGTENSLVLIPPITNETYIVKGNALPYGCPGQFVFNVTAPGPPAFTINVSDTSVCLFDSIRMNVAPSNPSNYQYNWTPAALFDNPTTISQTIRAEQSGWYSVTLSELGGTGCSLSDSIFIEVLPIFTFDLGNDTIICPNDSLIIAPSMPTGGSATWFNGSNAITYVVNSSIDSAVIGVTIADVNGCKVKDSIAVRNFSISPFDLGADLAICIGEKVLVGVNNAAIKSYLWSTNAASPQIVITESGVYTVTLVDTNNCMLNDTITILKNTNTVSFELGQDYSICEDEPIVLSPSMSEIDSIIWIDGTNSNAYTYDKPFNVNDTITLSATAFGCTSVRDTVHIYIEDCTCPIFVPNSFSPNGDQNNNTFKIYHNCGFKDFNFIILNRWGEVLFETQSLNFEWNGIFKGELVKSDTYVWRMRYFLDNQKIGYQNKVGIVTILR